MANAESGYQNETETTGAQQEPGLGERGGEGRGPPQQRAACRGISAATRHNEKAAGRAARTRRLPRRRHAPLPPLSLSLYTFFSHPFLFSRTPVSSLNPLAPRKTGWRRPDNPRGYSSAFRRGRGHYNHHQLWQDGSAFASLSLANLASTQAAPGTTQPLSQSTQSQHN